MKDIRGRLKMKTIKTTTFLGIAIVILSSIILLVSCTSGIGTVTDGLQQTNTSETTTAQTEPSVTPTHTSSTTTTATTTETATPTTTTTPVTTTAQTTTAPTSNTPTTATTVTTTAVEPKDVLIPVVGTEFPIVITYNYDKWTVLQFDFDIIHELGSDWHFPWSLTIKNETETDLELTAYIIHWGYHNLIGYVSKMPFVLKAGERKNLSGEDIMTETFVENMVYYEEVQIEVYIAEG